MFFSLLSFTLTLSSLLFLLYPTGHQQEGLPTCAWSCSRFLPVKNQMRFSLPLLLAQGSDSGFYKAPQVKKKIKIFKDKKWIQVNCIKALSNVALTNVLYANVWASVPCVPFFIVFSNCICLLQ